MFQLTKVVLLDTGLSFDPFHNKDLADESVPLEATLVRSRSNHFENEDVILSKLRVEIMRQVRI